MDIYNPNPQPYQTQTSDKQVLWQSLIDQAREKINNADWEAASVIYKEAFELAEQMMCKQSCNQHCSMSQYLNTAAEFAFVMKQNDFDCALAMFIGQIQNSIAEHNPALCGDELVEHLQASTCPANLWVEDKS